MGYDLKYFGATTGRDSGSGGWNAQNLPRDVVSGVDIRSLIEAPEGKMLVVCDLAQIEARCILYLARDKATLEVLRTGVDVYEAHARATMGYTDPRPLKDVDKALRQLAKARVLGLGFGCGANKFQVVAKMMAGLEISPQEAERVVKDYRKSNPQIVALWKELEDYLRRSQGSHLNVTLPSGRQLIYRDVKGGYESSGVIPRNGKMLRSKLYGGLLAENLTQAFARDVFMDRVAAVTEKGYEVILRVHDEVVCIVDEATAEDSRKEIETIMSTTPEWCKTLPVGAEADVMKRYAK
jgi:DNA polymerase